MTRSMAIKWLKWIQNMFSEDSEQYKALQFAINSMEVDEAYQLEYESTAKNDKVDCEHTDCNNCVNHKYCDYEPTTKNDLGVDAVSRILVQSAISKFIEYKENPYQLYKRIESLPSVTPQEPQTFKWCTDCKEYDQEKHCCHRWSKVIRNTVEEMQQEPKTGHWIKSRDCYGNNHFICSFCGHDIATKADIWDDNYCSNCGCRMIEPQEVRDKE